MDFPATRQRNYKKYKPSEIRPNTLTAKHRRTIVKKVNAHVIAAIIIRLIPVILKPAAGQQIQLSLVKTRFNATENKTCITAKPSFGPTGNLYQEK